MKDEIERKELAIVQRTENFLFLNKFLFIEIKIFQHHCASQELPDSETLSLLQLFELFCNLKLQQIEVEMHKCFASIFLFV